MKVRNKFALHPFEVKVHLLEDGVLGLVPVRLHGHGVCQGLHVHQVVDQGAPRLLNGASRGNPHPRDGVASHLGGEGEEPAHDGQLGGVVVRDVLQPGWHVMMVASSGSLVPGNIIVTKSESDWGQPVAIAIVTLVGLQVDEVLELLHLGQPLPGVVGETQVLQLVHGVKAEQDGVKDVHVDQGARLVRVAVRLLGLVL